MTADGLAVRGLHAGYGSMEAVIDVELDISRGEMVSVIGRNGAGKSTMLLCIAGMRYGRFGGSVTLDGEDLSKSPAAAVVKSGLVCIPEGHRIFRPLTVRENLRLGAFGRRKRGPKEVREAMERVVNLFPILGRYADRNAGFLSGGEQQMVAIGQGVMADPKILMLDEPTSGLAIPIIKIILGAMDAIRAEGVGVLFVEQNVQRALAHSDRTYVMERGRIAMSGPSASLVGNDDVLAVVRGVYGQVTAPPVTGGASNRATGS
jgi:branched-chain amino acid transport system ATP-binding protein